MFHASVFVCSWVGSSGTGRGMESVSEQREWRVYSCGGDGFDLKKLSKITL